mgnify:FL=1
MLSHESPLMQAKLSVPLPSCILLIVFRIFLRLQKRVVADSILGQ